MRYSVIIPAFNASRYLGECLNSLIGETNHELEIIVVDDGSTDDTGGIGDEFAKRHPETVKVIHQPNGGQFMARCRGGEAATGDYCLFLDADDFLAPNAFSAFDSLLEQYHCPDLIIFSFTYEYEDGTCRSARKLRPNEHLFNESDKQELYTAFFTETLLNNVWTKLVSRECLRKCRFEPEKYAELRCSEDRLQSMEIVSCAESVLYTPMPLYRYRLLGGTTTRDYSPESIARFNTKMTFGKSMEYMKRWGLTLSPWKEKMEAGWFHYAIYVFDSFFVNAKSVAQKKKVLAFDWDGFIPDEVKGAYASNPELNETKKAIWRAILEKQYWKIQWYVWKRDFRKWIKKWIRGKYCL